MKYMVISGVDMKHLEDYLNVYAGIGWVCISVYAIRDIHYAVLAKET